MVNAVYDHIVAILVVGAIFVAAVVALPAMSFVSTQTASQQQLRNTAINVFNAMLLGRGSPSNWGSRFPFNQSDVEAFGLAYSEECSLYVLDGDKVQRLDEESPWHIDYSRVRELLELGDYRFILTLFRPFTIGWDLGIDVPKKTVSFAVNVSRNEDGAPIPNAQVETTVMVVAKNVNTEEPLAVVYDQELLFTDALGRCRGSVTVNLGNDYRLETAIAIMKITVAGMSTLVVGQKDTSLQKWLKINTFGDTVTLTFRGELLDDPRGERRVYDIMTFSYDAELMAIYDGRGDPVTSRHITHGYGYDYWNKTFPGLSLLDPALLLFAISVPNPRRLAIITGPYSFGASYEVLRFPAEPQRVGDAVVKLRRFVVISGYTYVAELLLWKE